MEEVANILKTAWEYNEGHTTISFSSIDEGIIVKNSNKYIGKVIIKNNRNIIVFDDYERVEKEYIIYFLLKNLSALYDRRICIENSTIEY